MQTFVTLPLSFSSRMLRWEAEPTASLKEHSLNQVRALDRFLASVEKRAYRMARIAVRSDDDALDIVQDAMLQLARRYGERPQEEWPPLFYRILQNRIRDCQRRRSVRNRILRWLPLAHDEAEDPLAQAPDPGPAAVDVLATDAAIQLLDEALAALPARQQQAFMLRAFEGLDVADTAAAMGCSEGSVKTHYSRAVHALRAALGEAWEP